MIDTYYEEELRYLYNSGREFAKAHPDRAQFLNIDAVGDRDPYVERLFEGFAFLSARIREKLDDSFPELTEGIIDLLWPHFRQTIPSTAMVQFHPRKGFLQESRVLPRGTELCSGPVGPESAICKFITTTDVPLHPIQLESVENKVDTKGKGSLAFTFRIDAGVKWQALALSSLRLYIHAELPTALAIHEIITRSCIKAEAVFDDGRAAFQIDPENAISTGGLSTSESLLPADPRSFRGHALLLEYFVFPEKFLFADLKGFDKHLLSFSPEKLVCTFTFDKAFPAEKPFGVDNFRLFCSPAVNLFRSDTEPVINTGKESEYRVIASAQYRDSVETHSIISVAGIDRGTGERFPYMPFHSFKALGEKTSRTFATHYRQGFNGKRELSITTGEGQIADGQLHEETLSIEAW
jgi:type VI secretion system protein ImpG